MQQQTIKILEKNSDHLKVEFIKIKNNRIKISIRLSNSCREIFIVELNNKNMRNRGGLIKIDLILVIFIGSLMFSIPICFSLDLNLIYDNNGNLITGDGKYREYNEFNQLIRIRNGNSSSGKIMEEYLYHPTEDRILAKRVYDSSGQFLIQTVIYVNDNFVRTVTYPAADRINVSDKIYIKDEQGFVAEFNPDQSKLYYSDDHLGSTSVLTNDSQAVVEKTFYEPFGGIVSGGNTSRFYYEGKDFSSVIDEYDFNFRKYSPELKIFTKPDAGINDVYDVQGINRYAFEKGNPYKYVDNDGKAIVYFGAQSSGGAGIGGSASGGKYISYTPSEDIQEGSFSQYGIGLTTPTVSSGGLIGFSPLSDYKDLSGESIDISIDVGEIGIIGVNLVIPTDEQGNIQISKTSIEVSPSIGGNFPFPFSASILRTTTATIPAKSSSTLFKMSNSGLSSSSSHQKNSIKQTVSKEKLSGNSAKGYKSSSSTGSKKSNIISSIINKARNIFRSIFRGK